MRDLRIVFMGTPEFAVTILKKLVVLVKFTGICNISAKSDESTWKFTKTSTFKKLCGGSSRMAGHTVQL